MSRLHPIVFWLAGVKLAFHLLIIRGYGWFRDEFYYIACGERLDWGYVDHPPLVAVVTAITRFLLGDSLVAIRLPAALAGAATVVVAGLLARELGARRFGQGLAALAVLVATIYLPLHHILSMNAWEPLLWSSVALFVLRGAWTAGARANGSAPECWPGLRSRTSTACCSSGSRCSSASCCRPRGEPCSRAGPWLMGLIGRGDLPAEHHLGGAARLADAGVHAARTGAQERGAAARGVHRAAGAGDEPRERRSCG